MTPENKNDGLTETPPRWNLADLYDGPQDARIETDLNDLKQRAQAFATKYKGRVADLTASELADALREYEDLYRQGSLPGAFAGLRFAADASPETGAQVQQVRERTTDATLPVLFFDLELAKIPSDELAARGVAPELGAYRHYLQTVANRARFRLSEAEERVLEERANTGQRAFVRLYEEIVSNMRFSYNNGDKPLTLSETLDLQNHPDRTVRREGADALSAGLEAHARTIGYVFNTLLQDKATEDRLRGYAYQEQARHIANELTPETVEIVVQTAEEGFGLVARFYEAKRKMLGYDRLYHYDRYAPITDEKEKIEYNEARDITLSAFADFDPAYEAAARAFFTGGWIDAEARDGKRGGAFCSYITPDKHPFIFLNYLGKQGDVRTLAHELGHGIHSFLSRDQSLFNFHGTLPIAEVASTFAEQLVFEKQRATTAQADPQKYRALLSEQIEQALATIFRQAVLYRFEQAIHKARREGGELTVEQFGALWQENVGAMFGDSVTLEGGHALWWSYVRHFVATPFYVYAYTFGEMLALALFHKYQTEGKASFAPRYLEFLRSGGSKSPADLVAPLGVDLQDAAFWRGALALLEEQIKAFETLADA